MGACPQCKAQEQEGFVRKTPKGAGCSRWQEGCTFSVWQEQYGKKLSDSQIKELVLKGETKEIKGFKKKSGKGTYDAKLHLNEEFKVRLKFEDQEGGEAKEQIEFGSCPRCKEGKVRSTPRGAGCSRWREGCNFTVWREQYGKVLSDDDIKSLVTKKETGLIKDFKKKSGTGTYSAYLVLNEEFKSRLRFENELPGNSGAASASASATAAATTAAASSPSAS